MNNANSAVDARILCSYRLKKVGNSLRIIAAHRNSWTGFIKSIHAASLCGTAQHVKQQLTSTREATAL
jgi:hypothetical protein